MNFADNSTISAIVSYLKIPALKTRQYGVTESHEYDFTLIGQCKFPATTHSHVKETHLFFNSSNQQLVLTRSALGS